MMEGIGPELVAALMKEAPLAGALLWVGWMLDRRFARLEAMFSLIVNAGKDKP